MRFFLFFLCILFSSVPLQAKTLTGRVIHVSDGDTIRIEDKTGKKHEIRFYGIDTPEKEQSYGNAATKFTSRSTFRKHVSVKVYDIDRYDRTVGVVMVDHVNVNQSLIENGLAWQYSRYCKESFCDEWKEAELQARQNRLGLWAENEPTPPWEWRREQREGNSFSQFLKKVERVFKLLLEMIDRIEEILEMF